MPATDNPSYEPEGPSDSDQVALVEINSNTDESEPKGKGSVKVQINSSSPWKPYEDSKFDSPMLNRYVLPWPTYYKIRWMILSIFHTRLLFGIAVGEVLFFLIVIGAFAGGLAAMGGTLGRHKAKSTGSIACIPPALVFTFGCRNSVWILLTGLPFERALMWHKLFAYITVIIAVWHGYVSQKWDVTGTALTASFVAFSIFSFWLFRRHFFEAFYRIHWLLIIGVIVLFFAHGAGSIVIGALFWVLDLVLRGLIVFLNKRNEQSVLAVRLPANVIRLTFMKKNFQYKSGQYCFICIPEVSLFESHPFSISSSPHKNVVSFHIRVSGDWTKSLYDFVDETKTIKVYIDGPYGAPGIDVDGPKYKHFMFISGGIGITPMQSICNDVLYQHKRGRPLKKVMFIWSVRDLYMVSLVLEYDRKYHAQNEQVRLPSSFSLDLLNRSQLGTTLETHFHLTKERDSSNFAEANIHPELQPDLRFGRPNLTELFDKMKSYCERGERVGVLTCGPTSLVNDAEKYCSMHSGNGITFDFYKEVFEF